MSDAAATGSVVIACPEADECAAGEEIQVTGVALRGEKLRFFLRV